MRVEEQEYIDRNLKGYESDEFVHGEIKKLVDKFKVDLIIETGTFLGGTTRRLAEFCPVWSFEVMDENYQKAIKNCEGIKNITIKNCDSVYGLNTLLPQLSEIAIPKYIEPKILFFLDAHWWDACPLLDELKVIASHGIKPVIVIHDWKVPGRPDLGFDSYKGQDFTFEWIEQSLKNIYGNDFKYHYNDQASGAKRGLIYIYPND